MIQQLAGGADGIAHAGLACPDKLVGTGVHQLPVLSGLNFSGRTALSLPRLRACVRLQARVLSMVFSREYRVQQPRQYELGVW